MSLLGAQPQFSHLYSGAESHLLPLWEEGLDARGTLTFSIGAQGLGDPPVGHGGLELRGQSGPRPSCASQLTLEQPWEVAPYPVDGDTEVRRLRCPGWASTWNPPASASRSASPACGTSEAAALFPHSPRPFPRSQLLHQPGPHTESHLCAGEEVLCGFPRMLALSGPRGALRAVAQG